jgi:hypothetical protein
MLNSTIDQRLLEDHLKAFLSSTVQDAQEQLTTLMVYADTVGRWHFNVESAVTLTTISWMPFYASSAVIAPAVDFRMS